MEFKQLSLLILLALTCSVHAAVPDAGQTSRELQQQPELLPPRATEPLIPESTKSIGVAGDQARMEVTAIHVTGCGVFTASELEALLADLVGGQHSIAELEAGVARITAYYRSHGYIVARAYLPVQDIKEGVVTIAVLEGRIGEKRVNNQSLISDERARGYLSSIRSGEAVQARTANRALLLLNDTPGVGSAKALLQPGASVGTSDLVVELTPSPAYSSGFVLDNHGNRYTGEQRLGATFSFISPLKVGDQFNLGVLTTDQHLAYMRLAYQMPVSGSGLRLGGSYSETRYRLGKEFAALQAHGKADITSLYAAYPFMRSQSSNLSGMVIWERKHLNDNTDAPVTSSRQWIQLANLGLAGNHQDTIGGAGMTSFDLSWVSGSLDMDAITRAVDELSAKSRGRYTRLDYNFSRLQRLTLSDSLLLAISGQQSSRNLNTSEKLYLGGANSIRAYPQGEIGGDEGYFARMEWHHDYTPTLQSRLFYDAGSVKVNRNSYIAGTDNNRYIAGTGVGVSAKLSGMKIQASLAWRTRGGDPVSDPFKRNPRLWLLAGMQF